VICFDLQLEVNEMTFDIDHARWEKHVKFVQYGTTLAMLELVLELMQESSV
jgi:hypothetical protein